MSRTQSAGAVPTLRREDLDIELLAGGEIGILILIEVSVVVDRGDVIVPRRDIAVRATVRDRREIAAVPIDIRAI